MVDLYRRLTADGPCSSSKCILQRSANAKEGFQLMSDGFDKKKTHITYVSVGLISRRVSYNTGIPRKKMAQSKRIVVQSGANNLDESLLRAFFFNRLGPHCVAQLNTP